MDSIIVFHINVPRPKWTSYIFCKIILYNVDTIYFNLTTLLSVLLSLQETSWLSFYFRFKCELYIRINCNRASYANLVGAFWKLKIPRVLLLRITYWVLVVRNTNRNTNRNTINRYWENPELDDTVRGVKKPKPNRKRIVAVLGLLNLYQKIVKRKFRENVCEKKFNDLGKSVFVWN